MRILAVDSSALTASAAVLEDGIIKGEFSQTTSLTHSQTLMPMIDTLLRALKLSPNDIDVFACANGPGSFTGLRIGIGTVKGLAYGADKGAVGVCTLEALAYNVMLSPFQIAPVMDARRAQVYNALYKNDGGRLVCKSAPRAISVEDLCAEITEKTVFVGDGVCAYKDKLKQLLGDKCIFAPPQMLLQRAASIAFAASFKTAVSPAELDAFYLRKPQAEREREERIKNSL